MDRSGGSGGGDSVQVDWRGDRRAVGGVFRSDLVAESLIIGRRDLGFWSWSASVSFCALQSSRRLTVLSTLSLRVRRQPFDVSNERFHSSDVLHSSDAGENTFPQQQEQLRSLSDRTGNEGRAD